MNWFVLTVVVLAAGFLLARLLKKTLRVLLVCVLAAIAVAVAGGTAVCWSGPETDTAVEADYAVLLGCGLEEGEPTEELVRRMELAMDWLESNEGKTLIVSGGDPGGWGISEARIMYDWLEQQGADMSRILMEDQADDTKENLIFSKELAEQYGLNTDTVEILTSEYHQTRAQYLADQIGQAARGFSCQTPFLDHLSASVREVYAFVKALFETM